MLADVKATQVAKHVVEKPSMEIRKPVTSIWDGPPRRSPGTGRFWYLPDEFYFYDTPWFPADKAGRVTARWLAQWADRYEAFRVGNAGDRAGPLPVEPAERRAIINELFDLQEQVPAAPVHSVQLNLYQGDLQLLDQHDGMPGLLALTPEQFLALQEVWCHHGLPPDLYYPAHEMRIVVEPVEMLGGVVRWTQFYSKLRWERRAEEVGELRPAPPAEQHRADDERGFVPTEEQRRANFQHALDAFQRALALRFWEMHEPGAESDPAEVEMLSTLSEAIQRAREAGTRGQAESDR